MASESGKFDVTMACTVCATQRPGQFTMPELLELVEKQSKLMACEKCQVSTSWSAIEVDRRRGPRRATRRVPVKMPIRVETSLDGEGFAETTHTVDVSKGGVRFFSERNYPEGMELIVRVPYETEFEREPIRAKVIWLVPAEHGFHVGIDFLS